ncbi:MAG TPA: Smr/MutS family protein [Vicinamibacterales bacterium]|nr:Smr/MutS family protein [Vicinamibacterales bacterium]
MHEVPIEQTFDLHSFRPEEIPSVVEEYLRAAYENGFREVRLIHGRGIGVQRGVVHRLLRAHPLVAEFHDAPESHLGATVVRLTEH